MRSAIGRRVGVSRWYSLKPVTLPTDHLPLHMRLRASYLRRDDGRGNTWHTQDALVFMRKYFDKFRQHGIPMFQDPFPLRAVSEFGVPADQAMQDFDVLV